MLCNMEIALGTKCEMVRQIGFLNRTERSTEKYTFSRLDVLQMLIFFFLRLVTFDLQRLKLWLQWVGMGACGYSGWGWGRLAPSASGAGGLPQRPGSHPLAGLILLETFREIYFMCQVHRYN